MMGTGDYEALMIVRRVKSMLFSFSSSFKSQIEKCHFLFDANWGNMKFNRIMMLKMHV